MASRNVVSRIPPSAMAAVRKEVFGQMPQRNVRTGYKFLKKSHTGVFDERWYPESIEKSAREVRVHGAVEWSGVEWSGVEWSGVEWSGALVLFCSVLGSLDTVG
eukprot:scaffold163010_cov66-Attheya_sp.AAC.3